jgi:hypothetical protein
MRRAKANCKERDELVRRHAMALQEVKRLGVPETNESRRTAQAVQEHNEWGHDGNRCPGN